MRTLSSSFACTLVVACAVSDQRVTHPIATPGRNVPVFSTTEPAPHGSELRVFQDPDKLVGWIAGSESFAGQPVHFDGHPIGVVVGDDNTFTIPIGFSHRAEAEVRVGELAQQLTIVPPASLEPAAYIVTDRSAYRPGQKLQLTAFLRRIERGELRPDNRGRVEVKIVSETKKTTAAKLALAVDANGRASGEYTFSTSDPLDTYSIELPGYRGTAKVTLAEYRKSKVKLDVDATVVDGDAELTFRALDFLDKPVPGGAVTFTAQLVREPDEKPPLSGFAYGGPPVLLARDEMLLHAADPDTAGRMWDAGRYVVDEVQGQVTLDGRGTGWYRMPIQSSHLRGRHQLIVESRMIDANGYEQRTSRTLPLARRDHRVQVETRHPLVATGSPIDVTVRVTDANGRLVVPASTSIAAVKISPPIDAVVFGNNYIGNNFNNNVIINNGHWVGGPNGGHWVGGPNGYWVNNIGGRWNNVATNNFNCRFTNAGCGFGNNRPRSVRAAQVIPDDTLAATAAVIGDTASLALPDPGAYRLVASAKLLDGTTVWGEAGVAVRAKEIMPALVLELDRAEVDHGDRIAGTLHSRFRDARALLVVRDANGIRSRHRTVLANGSARFELPSEGVLYGASVEAYVLGEERSIEAAQQALHVVPKHRALAIRTTAKDKYGPGDTVDLGIDVGVREQVDLVISVYDQSLLGIAPDRSVDPRSFFFADERVAQRAGLATLAAQLGDLTVGQLLAIARERARNAPRSVEGNFEREATTLLTQMLDGRTITGATMVMMLRYLGIPATGNVSYPWTPLSKRELENMRVIDLTANFSSLAFVRAADTIAIFDPNQQVLKPVQGISFSGNTASGNSFVAGNASFSRSAPAIDYVAGPAPLSGLDQSSSTIRRDFSDSAYWSGIARTDASGHAQVSFKLPDSLTNWQVVVTAIGRKSVGRHTAKLRTVRDVMIWPLLPRQIVEGDTIAVGASVHNLTDRDRDIAVSLQTQNVDILTPASLSVRVPAGSSIPVTWRVRARESGLATLLASANTLGASPDASLKRIPIVSSSAEQVLTASGFATKPLQLELPAGADLRHTRLELTFAPSLVADMVSTLDYLVEYPYGCAEQTMSRFAPAIEVAGVLDNLGIKDGVLAARLPSVVAGGLKRLTELQQPDGGWAWNGHAETHEMITPYVVWGLLRAERAGYKLPSPTTLERGLDRIHGLIASRSAESQLSDRTYLMYVYAQKRTLTDQWWKWLVERVPQMSDYALALTLQIAVARKDGAMADRLATALRARATRTDQGVHWKTGSFSRWMEDPFETSAVALAALVAHDSRDPMIADSLAYFTATKRGDRWNSTKDTAMILYAMTAYVRAQRIAAGKTSALDFTVDGGAPRHVTFADGFSRTVTIDGRALSRRPTISFTNASPGILVRAVLRYRSKSRDLAPMTSGLAVTRTVNLLDGNGKFVKTLASGDRVPRGSYVESVVRVNSVQRELMRYLLIEDPKPAGAEALPITDPRTPEVYRSWVLREDRETHLAFHHEETASSTETHTVLHLESAGDLAFVPASAELMYQTQTRGHSGSFRLQVD